MVPSVGSRGKEGTQILGGGVLVPSLEFEKVAEGEKTALFQPAFRVLRLIVWRRGRVRWNRLKKRRVIQDLVSCISLRSSSLRSSPPAPWGG